MAVEVGADPVQDLAGEAVVLPLLRVELQHALVHQVLAVLWTGKGSGVAAAGRGVRTGTDLQQAGQVVLQELLEPLVEFQADELRAARSGGLLGGFGWRDGAPGLAGLVDAGAVVIDMSERHALRNWTHRTKLKSPRTLPNKSIQLRIQGKFLSEARAENSSKCDDQKTITSK